MFAPPPVFAALPQARSLALPVGGGHVVSVQTYGSAGGASVDAAEADSRPVVPVVLVHGGPGSGQSPILRAPFEGSTVPWHVVCIDQRGCGASRPRGSVDANTTVDLVDDMEQVRSELGIPAWLVVGGSWGASLALAYACAHPSAVTGVLLRSSFVARRRDVAAFFAGGPFGDDVDVTLARLHEDLLGSDDAKRVDAAQAWRRWERRQLGFEGDVPVDAAAIDRYRVQIHYLVHDCWLGEPDLVARAAGLSAPVALLHGDADRVCPIGAARELARAMPHARWLELPGVGHDPTAPAMIAAARGALEAFARDGNFDGNFEPRDRKTRCAP